MARRAQLVAPAYTPFQALGENEGLKPSPYSYDVTPTGAATWNMPLWLPAGRNGMQPALSLTYHSKGGTGTLGLGFGVYFLIPALAGRALALLVWGTVFYLVTLTVESLVASRQVRESTAGG